MEESAILVKQEEQIGLVKVVGKGSFKNARHIKDYAEQVFKTGVCALRLDLKDCTHMDSTFMGVMAGLASLCKRSGKEPPQVVNLSARNRELLSNLGLDRIIDIKDESSHNGTSPSESFKVLEAEEEKKKEATETMLEAHQNLIDADERNAAKFQDVVSFLKQKIEKAEG